MRQKIVGCGLSGLIGRPLAKALADKYDLVILKRSLPGKTEGPFRQVQWNPGKEGAWMKELEGAHAVINLCGEPIAERRWSQAQKKKLKASRLNATHAIVQAIARAESKPACLINASGIGYYGPHENELLDETAAGGAGFLAETCQAWEAEASKAKSLSGVRTVLLRTGIVLSKEGGALAKMLPPFQLFIGGALGSGRQVMSWVHIDDEVRAILKVLEDPVMEGPVNITTPAAVTMGEFAETLGRALGRPSLFPVPALVLRLILGEMSEMLLTGQNVCPKKLLAHGFQFQFSSLDKALENLL